MSWSTSTLSYPRTYLTASSFGNKILFAGGIGGGTSPYSNKVDIYNTENGSWSTATLSQGRSDLASASTTDAILFGGGFYASYPNVTNIVDIYDGTSWSIAALSQARYLLSAASDSSKILFGGGQLFNGSFSKVLDIYDTSTKIWSTAFLSDEKSRLAAAGNNGYILFGGGYKPNPGYNPYPPYPQIPDVRMNLYLNSVDIYNTNTNNITQSNLSIDRCALAAAGTNGKILFAGGFNTWLHYSTPGEPFSAVEVRQDFDTVDIYDTNTGTWTVSSLSMPRSYVTAAPVGNKIMFIGGKRHYYPNGYPNYTLVDYPNLIDIYDTVTGTWSVITLSIFTADTLGRESTLAAAGTNDKLLIGGGYGPNGQPTASVPVYTPDVTSYTVTYYGNDNDSGSVPVDSELYEENDIVEVLDIEDLARTGYVFDGWKTITDEFIVHLYPSETFLMPALDVTFYAQWKATVTYYGNSNTSGTPPVDSTLYNEDDTVTVLGSGDLAKTNYTFMGWNTKNDESGTHYAPNSMFQITNNITLYAQWESQDNDDLLFDGGAYDEVPPENIIDVPYAIFHIYLEKACIVTKLNARYRTQFGNGWVIYPITFNPLQYAPGSSGHASSIVTHAKISQNVSYAYSDIILYTPVYLPAGISSVYVAMHNESNKLYISRDNLPSPYYDNKNIHCRVYGRELDTTQRFLNSTSSWESCNESDAKAFSFTLTEANEISFIDLFFGASSYIAGGGYLSGVKVAIYPSLNDMINNENKMGASGIAYQFTANNCLHTLRLITPITLPAGQYWCILYNIYLSQVEPWLETSFDNNLTYSLRYDNSNSTEAVWDSVNGLRDGTAFYKMYSQEVPHYYLDN